MRSVPPAPVSADSIMAKPEVWLRGPVAGVPAGLQPVAHSLLQSREEVSHLLPTLLPEELWHRPGEAASAGYHILHATGSIDRLFTYARRETLSAAQLAALAAESAGGNEAAKPSADALLAMFHDRIELALTELRATRESSLLDAREVGRARMPSTVIGLLFHAAEHTQRHVGQFVTTVRLLRSAGASARR